MSTLFDATPFKGTSIKTAESVSSHVKSFTRIGILKEQSHYHPVSWNWQEMIPKTEHSFIITMEMWKIVRHLENTGRNENIAMVTDIQSIQSII